MKGRIYLLRCRDGSFVESGLDGPLVFNRKKDALAERQEQGWEKEVEIVRARVVVE